MGRLRDSFIDAVNAFVGLAPEESFRNTVAADLGESFGVEVVHLTLADEEGEVYGLPDQVELTLVLKNGMTIACEIKSSIDKAGMYSFGRKVDFYEKHEQRPISRASNCGNLNARICATCSSGNGPSRRVSKLRITAASPCSRPCSRPCS